MKKEELVFYEEYRSSMEKALKAMDDGNVKMAKYHLYRSASILLKLAQMSRGERKEKRYRMAERIVKIADSLRIEENAKTKVELKFEENRCEMGSAEGSFERPDIGFDDIAGLEDAKREIMLRSVLPLKYPEKAKKYRKTVGGGILLYGPPGTGKTMLAKATAGEVNAPFFSISPSDVLSKWFGEAEKRIAELFEKARSYDLSVVFIDEVESLVPSRDIVDSSPMNRVVAQILAELDGMRKGKGKVLFIGATNIPWKLDPAVLRPGRFDVMIYVGLPDERARRRMFEMFLKDLPLDESINFDELVKMSKGYTGADIKSVCEEAKSIPFFEAVIEDKERPINMSDFKRAFEKIKPSVDEDMMKRYEEFSKTKVRNFT